MYFLWYIILEFEKWLCCVCVCVCCTNIAEYPSRLPSCFVHQVKYLEVPGVHPLHERLMVLQHGIYPELLLALHTIRSEQVVEISTDLISTDTGRPEHAKP